MRRALALCAPVRLWQLRDKLQRSAQTADSSVLTGGCQRTGNDCSPKVKRQRSVPLVGKA